jgi:DNA polymerase III subunit gamma/tau
MRTSMHGRTLVEMAVVRICNLGDLDELADLIAELRGQQSEPGRLRPRPEAPAKKNIEPSPITSLAESLAKQEKDEAPETVATPTPDLEAPITPLRVDPPHVTPESATASNGSLLDEKPSDEESVLAQWQRALTDGPQQATDVSPPRASRREQLTAIAEQPLVRRAMELFDVAPNQMRYTPPEGDNN